MDGQSHKAAFDVSVLHYNTFRYTAIAHRVTVELTLDQGFVFDATRKTAVDKRAQTLDGHTIADARDASVYGYLAKQNLGHLAVLINGDCYEVLPSFVYRHMCQVAIEHHLMLSKLTVKISGKSTTIFDLEEMVEKTMGYRP